EAGARHLENTELVGRAEAVLDGSQDAVRVVAVALELQHAVDEMLKDSRPGDRAVLRHVPDQDRRDGRFLGHAEEPSSGLAHLRAAPRRRPKPRGVERWDESAHPAARRLGLRGLETVLDPLSREDPATPRPAEPPGARLDRGPRPPAGDEQRPPLSRD